MRHPTPRRGDKFPTIVAHLKQRIFGGELAPEQRLPTRVELRQQFAAGPDTVQRALDRLISEGFVVARGRRGTFVATHLPHRCRSALVFPFPAARIAAGPSLGSAMVQLATTFRSPKRQVELFWQVDGHADGEDYRRLLAAMRAQRLAGIIFATSPHLLRGTPLLDEPGMPRVAVTTASDDRIPAIYVDHRQFFDRAVARLQAHQCRRIAVLTAGTYPDQHQLAPDKLARDSLVAHGCETPAYWFQAAHPNTPWQMRRIVHLMMQPTPPNRPDALIVADDTLVEPTTRGLHDAGVRVPDDVEVLAQCNYPLSPSAATPVTRLGFETHVLFDRCFEAIDAQRHGEPVQPALHLTPKFEDEVTRLTHASDAEIPGIDAAVEGQRL